MNQVDIGKFIAACRKEKNLTQAQLAEKLNITDRAFSASLLIGIIVCMICDLALTGGLTWSLIPISSILFAWAIVFPAVMAGRRGIFKSLVISLVILSILIIPFLYVLSIILKVKAVFSIGAVMSVFSILLLWILAGFFYRFRNSKLFATGLSLLLIIPFDFVTNFTLSKMLNEPRDYVWDVLTAFILLILSVTFFTCDRVVNEQAIKKR